MPFIPSFGGIELAITWKSTTSNQNCVNVIHFLKPTGGVTTGDLSDVLSWLNTNYWPQLRTCLAIECQFAKAIARSLENATGPEVTLNTITNPAGTAAGGLLPGSSALSLSWRTANIGRAGRGRSYIGPLGRSDALADTITTVLVNKLFLVGSAYIGGHPNPNINAALRSHLGVMTPLTGFVVDTVLDVVRSRLTNRGT